MSGDLDHHTRSVSIHHEQRRIGHICAILVRNLSLRPTRDRALQTLTSQRPGGSNRYHTTSDDADLTLSLARSNSKGKAKADNSRRRQRSASWSRIANDGSSDEDQQQAIDELEATPTKSPINSSRKNARGRSALLANHRRTSDHELTTSSSLASISDGAHSIEASPRPILKRASSHRDGRDARMHHHGGGSPSSTATSSFLDEFGANTTMLSRSDSRSSSHSSHTIRRPSHRARTTSMTSSTSVRSVRFDESHVGASDEARRPARVSGRLSAASRYALFSQKSLAQIMKDRMLECQVELSLASESDEVINDAGRVFYRSSNSKPGLNHSWGYQGGDPITPERDFAIQSEAFTDVQPLEASVLSIKVWARAPPPSSDKGDTATQPPVKGGKGGDDGGWKLVCQTRTDLRDLEPLPGNAQEASMSLPPNSILLGLAPGANSLSGRVSISSSDPHSGTDTGLSGEPKLKRKVSEREAERTRHVLESIIYYTVPLQSVRQGSADTVEAQASSQLSPTDKRTPRDAKPSRQSDARRRPSLEGYASDPENAPSHKAGSAVVTDQAAALTQSTSNPTAVPSETVAAATSEAKRRERRKAFEDEQRRVLELSLRETKMMSSYTLDDAKHLARKQSELRNLLAELEELRHVEGDTLQDQEGFVQLRLKREQQKARYEAVRQLAIDESDELQRKRAELAERRSMLEARQAAIQASKSLFDAAETSARRHREQVQVLNEANAEIALRLHMQQASLLRDLETIFPIELSDASSLLFSVCGLPLPNAVSSLTPAELANEERRWKDTVKRQLPASTRPVFHPFDDDTVSSALGLVAQLVVLLSTYLATPIHYPLATAGSRAVVQDGISLMSGPRAFPLYAKGMERYRYEYAAFLLNKDIEQLMNVHSVTVIDIRHTLPNLKNLMVTVAAAPPTSQLTRKSHIGKTEIALRSAPVPMEADMEAGANGNRKAGMGIGLGLPSLTGAANANGANGGQGAGKKEAGPDALVTTRVLGAPSTATATPATATGAIASVSRALSYFSGGSAR
ncbi:hypothetical protein EX895_005590 [Sporisorium graminicola]|uniref:Autophagy-related protein 14 n=1 Tax=Sporisorium graminicola TaxID=280036 RepID=A0A4U7KQH0_9BASI|nr:hypothetical protein EX895_005590 [Sporisorium graminicola]TKY85428.1 hypothetical protein EX895_005590 [Sporisorium graminicola]